ncbi:MAG: hypothetical protein LC624_01575 [Halobacteriales archaeon]|nr:hypothetical protein [Halobacteriales archaeon]
MMLTPRFRKVALTAHVTFAVGWMGAVVAFLALVLGSMASADAQLLRGAWTAMSLMGWFAIVPLALASFVTGLVMSLGTKWGLFRHYWTLISLALTAVAVGVLLGNMQTVSSLARMAADADPASVPVLRSALPSELLHAGLGLVVLLVVQVLNVYKPRGLTRHGRRMEQQARP